MPDGFEAFWGSQALLQVYELSRQPAGPLHPRDLCFDALNGRVMVDRPTYFLDKALKFVLVVCHLPAPFGAVKQSKFYLIQGQPTLGGFGFQPVAKSSLTLGTEGNRGVLRVTEQGLVFYIVDGITVRYPSLASGSSTPSKFYLTLSLSSGAGDPRSLATRGANRDVAAELVRVLRVPECIDTLMMLDDDVFYDQRSLSWRTCGRVKASAPQ